MKKMTGKADCRANDWETMHVPRSGAGSEDTLKRWSGRGLGCESDQLN